MARRAGLVLAIAAALVAPGCGDDSRGGLTAEEERQLDEAARMLDENMADIFPEAPELDEAEALAEENLQPAE